MMSPPGTSRQFAALHQFGRYWSERGEMGEGGPHGSDHTTVALSSRRSLHLEAAHEGRRIEHPPCSVVPACRLTQEAKQKIIPRSHRSGRKDAGLSTNSWRIALKDAVHRRTNGVALGASRLVGGLRGS